ncbi:hypothetical protein FACS189476_00710 [Spirochaetia bacterium]|nr:hypothetical protein FACS189476_00710 [Spirochaetia bacterium]
MKAIRRFCGCDKGNRKVSSNCKNVPEKKRTKAAGRLRFFVGQAATAAQRIAYVMCSCAVPHYSIYVFLYFASIINNIITPRELNKLLHDYFSETG